MIKPGQTNSSNTPLFSKNKGKEFQKEFVDDIKNHDGEYEQSSCGSSELKKASDKDDTEDQTFNFKKKL